VTDINLADAWEAVADVVPERVALRCDGAERTYVELEERANCLAHWLLDTGVQPGQHVGVYLQNCCEYVEAMLALFKIRAVPINVNFRYTADELRHLFDDADLVGVITQEEYRALVANVAVDTSLRFSLVTGPDYEDALATSSRERDFATRSGDDHYVLYTGGTTGMPKGVVWRQDDAFVACMSSGNARGAPVASVPDLVELIPAKQTCFLALAPLMHASGAWAVMLHLFSGGRVVLWSGPLDPPEVWRTIEREGVTTMTVVGDAVMRPLLDGWDALDPTPALASLAIVHSGGAPLTPALRERFLARFPKVPLVDGFGSSETGVQAFRFFKGPSGGDAPEARFVPSDAIVMDVERRRPVEPGADTVGRLARSGRIPLAYYNDPAKSAETFVEWDGRRWALSGDMAMVAADGTITVLGRGSICINTGGEKVYPEEVEAVLRRDDDVYDVLVVGAPDERWGEAVVAVVEPAPGAVLTEDGIRSLARMRLAGYKVPKRVVFVDAVVRTPSGKPDYRWAAEVASSLTALRDP
jgi:acyl-CoA synthetase (AMP-forming)/AMP-acid ligase II